MKKILVMLVVAMMMSAVAVNAGDGDGSGKSKLKLESSVPESGTSGVALDEAIKLKFSNNVVNMKVSDNNMTCFTLLDSKGNEVAIEVLMGDDQVNQDIKNDVVIKPVNVLAKNESYQLIVSGQMMAKNGTLMEDDSVIEFDTNASGGSTLIYVVIAAIVIVLVAVFVFARKKK